MLEIALNRHKLFQNFAESPQIGPDLIRDIIECLTFPLPVPELVLIVAIPTNCLQIARNVVSTYTYDIIECRNPDSLVSQIPPTSLKLPQLVTNVPPHPSNCIITRPLDLVFTFLFRRHLLPTISPYIATFSNAISSPRNKANSSQIVTHRRKSPQSRLKCASTIKSIFASAYLSLPLAYKLVIDAIVHRPSIKACLPSSIGYIISSKVLPTLVIARE